MCHVYPPVAWKMQTAGIKYLLRPENSGLIEYKEVIQTKFKEPPQLKYSKAQIQQNFHYSFWRSRANIFS